MVNNDDGVAVYDHDRRSIELKRVEVSIIIPLHRDSARFQMGLQRFLNLQFSKGYEIVVVTDTETVELPKWIKHVTTGLNHDSGPGVKRDKGLNVARGSIIAFIDDDAYPQEDWLERAIGIFEEYPNLAALGGPGLTPPDSSWRERVGGAIYESRLGSGPLRRRFRASHGAFLRHEDDLPAFNLLVRRDALNAIGGWKTNLYGGEDTRLCERLVEAGFILAYNPGVVVYHYRRPIFTPHLKQIANIARHRGAFAHSFAATSRRIIYYLPSAVTLSAIAGIVCIVSILLAWPQAALPIVIIFLLAWLTVALTAVRKLRWAALLFPAALASHHICYGVSFVVGYLKSDRYIGGAYGGSPSTGLCE